MSRIRSKNTLLEINFCRLLSKELYPKGYRYRRNYPNLKGTPDIAFVKYKVAVFIDGDFWHGYNFKNIKKRLPKKYWLDKIGKNILRDRKINRELREKGWQVIRLWEHEIKKDSAKALNKIIKELV